LAWSFSANIVRTLGAETLRHLGAGFSPSWTTCGFFDLGLKHRRHQLCARFLATREPEKINEVINTALFLTSSCSESGSSASTTLASSYVAGFFQVSPPYRQEFLSLLLLTA